MACALRAVGYHLHRLADATVGAYRIDGDHVAAVGRAEQETPAAVVKDVGEALGERPGTHERQCARRAVDAVGVRRERLRADRGDEKALVRAHGHRHHDLLGLVARAGLERAVGLQRVHADVAVFCVRDVDEGRSRARALKSRIESRHDDSRDDASDRPCFPRPRPWPAPESEPVGSRFRARRTVRRRRLRCRSSSSRSISFCSASTRCIQ